MPLSCRCQTGRCLNDRLRQHNTNVHNAKEGCLSIHCQSCGCTPLFEETTIMGRHQDTHTCEIIEAAHIAKEGSLSLSMLRFIDKRTVLFGRACVTITWKKSCCAFIVFNFLSLLLYFHIHFAFVLIKSQLLVSACLRLLLSILVLSSRCTYFIIWNQLAQSSTLLSYISKASSTLLLVGLLPTVLVLKFIPLAAIDKIVRNSQIFAQWTHEFDWEISHLRICHGFASLKL